MVEWTHHGTGETGSRLAAGILLIVVTGVALGVAYNALQQQANPSKALAWVRKDVALKSLEELQGARPPAEGPTGGAGVAPAEPAVVSGGADGPPPTGQPPQPGGQIAAAATDPGAQPAPGPGAAAPAEKPVAVVALPVQTLKSADSPPAPPLPAIPDLKEPLDAKLTTVKQFFDARAAVIVDARTPEEYTEGHIQGAVSLPFDDVARDQSLLKRFAAGGKPVIVYCGGGDCELSRDLASLLIDAGHRKVLVYMGGYPEWQGAGYPTVKGAAGGAR